MDIPMRNDMQRPILTIVDNTATAHQVDVFRDFIVESLGSLFASTDDEKRKLLETREVQSNGQTKFVNEVGWALSQLYLVGLLARPKPKLYRITEQGRALLKSGADVSGFVNERAKERDQARKQAKAEKEKAAPTKEDEAPMEESADWSEVLLDTLQNMHPSVFEKLCQRLLRESGFIEVTVTGRSGDGGIDGHGIIRLAGLISFPVLFQCKRYSGNVGTNVVRDFRGAMEGRAEKGLILTTGGFTKSAQEEAIRDGAKPIDLIDGELLTMKMKELKLGVHTSIIETEVVQVDTNWFDLFSRLP